METAVSWLPEDWNICIICLEPVDKAGKYVLMCDRCYAHVTPQTRMEISKCRTREQRSKAWNKAIAEVDEWSRNDG